MLDVAKYGLPAMGRQQAASKYPAKARLSEDDGTNQKANNLKAMNRSPRVTGESSPKDRSPDRRDKDLPDEPGVDRLVAKLAKDPPIPPVRVGRKLFEDFWKEFGGPTVPVHLFAPEQAVALPQLPETEEGEMPDPDKAAEFILSSSPVARFIMRDQEIEQYRMAGAVDAVLVLRQQMLGLAKVYQHLTANEGNPEPCMRPYAHLRMAEAYADKGYVKQAIAHCKRSLETLVSLDSDQSRRYLKEARVLYAQFLLAASPPRASLALQHLDELYTGEDGNFEDDILRALTAQAYAAMGEQLLHEVSSTNNTKEGMQAQVGTLETRLRALEEQEYEYSLVQKALQEVRGKWGALAAKEARVLSSSEEKLTKALEVYGDVISREEAFVHKQFGDDLAPTEAQYRLVAALYRRSAEVTLALSDCKKLQEDYPKALELVEDVLNLQARYDFLPLNVVAHALERKGPLLVKVGRAEEALVVYEELYQLEEQRFAGHEGPLAYHQAECLKAMGNVNIALKKYAEAEDNLQQSLDLYHRVLPAEHPICGEMEHRIEEVANLV